PTQVVPAGSPAPQPSEVSPAGSPAAQPSEVSPASSAAAQPSEVAPAASSTPTVATQGEAPIQHANAASSISASWVVSALAVFALLY
ncbi:hypothetical protein KEM55_000812, partial [Ascosphaera atra]